MKRIISIVALVLIGALVWYLFIKPYDYLVTFKANALPGTINQSIKTWISNIDPEAITNHIDIKNLEQQISFNDSTFLYKWKIIPLTDSTSKVKVFVKDVNNSFDNKIFIPFRNTDFEKRTKSTVIDFTEKLSEHLRNFKVTIHGENELEGTYCVYVPIKGTQIKKAKGMMQNYSLLSQFIIQNNIKLNGKPMVEITKWDINKDSIYYNFCYPIIKNDSLPKHEIIRYKQISQAKALKAIYNGNYITSDRAWYALMDYARKNNITIEKKPIEIFYNNPNMGGDEMLWKAEIFMPIKAD